LYEFITERKVIGTIEVGGQTNKVKGSRVQKAPNYVEPLFELKILPFQVFLPMVRETYFISL
jgi:hypothetical protein